jgi:vancomycin resistance protein YoaR
MRRRLWLALFAALGGLAAWIAMPPPKRADPPPELTAVTLDGRAIVPSQPLPSGVPLPGDDADALAAAVRDATRAWLAAPLSVVVDGKRYERTRAQLGARLDGDHAQSLAAQLRDPKSALRRARGPIALPIPYALDGQAAMAELLQLKDEHDVPAVDARYDFPTRKVTPDAPGRRIDAWATLARIDGALARGEASVEAVVEPVAARRTAAQLAEVSTDAVLGWFETKYARDLKHEARTFNLRLAASKLDGAVLLPGETFDFNAAVGPRTEMNGYRVAPVIAQGELVDGMGGGTCQVAGTLHAAAFFAGLDMPERRPHTRPSFYIKMGLDAAVAYPTVTLKLSNPYPFPVVLRETVQAGVVRAEVLGPRRTRDVTFERRVDEVIGFAEREVNDPNLPKGARELRQRGIPGFKVTRWRIVRDGPFAVREHHQDYYPPTSQIWHVGTGAADPAFEAKDDEHPEYVADEFLTIAQGPDIKGPQGSDTVESRVPGRTGDYGWTVREGFAKVMHGTRARGAAEPDSREGID